MSAHWEHWASTSGPIDCRLTGEGPNPDARLEDIDDAQLQARLRGEVASAKLSKIHANWLAAGNAHAAERLKSHGSYVFAHYGEIALGSPIDWSLGDVSLANLAWQIHSLPFLRDLAAAHARGGADWALPLAYDLLADWANKNVREERPSRFSWNDHSTAIRLTNIGNLFLYVRGLPEIHHPLMRLLLQLAWRHQRILLDDKFYTRGTNHGLDQAFALFLSTHFFSKMDPGAARTVALERLRYELE